MFLASILREMRPGARLLFKDMDGSRWLFRILNHLHDLILTGHWGNERTPDEVVAWLENEGFEVREVTRRRILVYAHYMVDASQRDPRSDQWNSGAADQCFKSPFDG
jgi:hypothetical protein